jgi:hypothetical protein
MGIPFGRVKFCWRLSKGSSIRQAFLEHRVEKFAPFRKIREPQDTTVPDNFRGATVAVGESVPHH